MEGISPCKKREALHVREAAFVEVMSDLRRWHLQVKEGRQRWTFEEKEAESTLQSVVDRYHLGLDVVSIVFLL